MSIILLVFLLLTICDASNAKHQQHDGHCRHRCEVYLSPITSVQNLWVKDKLYIDDELYKVEDIQTYFKEL